MKYVFNKARLVTITNQYSRTLYYSIEINSIVIFTVSCKNLASGMAEMNNMYHINHWLSLLINFLLPAATETEGYINLPK